MFKMKPRDNLSRGFSTIKFRCPAYGTSFRVNFVKTGNFRIKKPDTNARFLSVI